MEGAQLLFSCNTWLEDVNAFIQATRLELAYERSMAVRTKGMAVTEAVARAVANEGSVDDNAAPMAGLYSSSRMANCDGSDQEAWLNTSIR